MSLQDKLEQILREIHVLIAEAQVYNAADNQIIIDKKVMYEHLNRLNVAIYEIMDEYELTQQSRDKAERDARKLGDDIVHQADLKAEDVYAASILYTNEALSRMQNIMQEAMDRFDQACNQAKDLMEEEKRTVRSNQSELKGQLQYLQDSEKYLTMIRETNLQLEREREKELEEERAAELARYADSKSSKRINQEYYEKIGVPVDEEGNPILEEPVMEEAMMEEAVMEEPMTQETEKKVSVKPTVTAMPLDLPTDVDLTMLDLGEEKPLAAPEEPEIKVNLNAEYFKRKRSPKKS